MPLTPKQQLLLVLAALAIVVSSCTTGGGSCLRHDDLGVVDCSGEHEWEFAGTAELNFAEYSYFQVPAMEQSQWMVIASAECEQFLENLPSPLVGFDFSMQFVAAATAIPTAEDYEAGERTVECSVGVEPTTSIIGNVRQELAPITGAGSLIDGTWVPAGT